MGAGGDYTSSGERERDEAGKEHKEGGGEKALLTMLRIQDFIPTKWKAFEVVGLGCTL